MRRILCIAVGFAALLLAPLAHADSHDNQFLSAVAALGITAPSDQLIAAAHTVCDVMGGGGGFLGYVPVQNQLLGMGVPSGQIQQVYVAAGRAYCPDKLHAAGLS